MDFRYSRIQLSPDELISAYYGSKVSKDENLQARLEPYLKKFRSSFDEIADVDMQSNIIVTDFSIEEVQLIATSISNLYTFFLEKPEEFAELFPSIPNLKLIQGGA